MRTVLAIALLTINMNLDAGYLTSGCAGILVAKSEFDKSVDELNKLYTNNASLKRSDYILSVRIYNTIAMNNLINANSEYKTFYEFFSRKYLGQTARALHAKMAKGFCFYSKKYDLFIGGEPHANSIFCVQK